MTVAQSLPSNKRSSDSWKDGMQSSTPSRPESSAPNAPAGPGPVTKASQSGDKESLDNWLRSLDGEGVMMMYSEALNREFSSISELSAAIVDPTAKGLKVVEPSLWEILGIQRLGHKLFFSQGLKNLQQSMSLFMIYVSSCGRCALVEPRAPTQSADSAAGFATGDLVAFRSCWSSMLAHRRNVVGSIATWWFCPT
eukprot:symbB.v1.2.022747.t1/scaffold1999.1/size159930/4